MVALDILILTSGLQMLGNQQYAKSIFGMLHAVLRLRHSARGTQSPEAHIYEAPHPSINLQTSS